MEKNIKQERFENFIYERPNLEKFTKETDEICESLEKEKDFLVLVNEIESYNKKRDQVFTMITLVSIRYSINTLDEFYEKENDFMDENIPLFDEQNNRYLKAIYNCSFREKLEEKYGKRLFDIIEVSLKTFSKEIIPELQEESKLQSKYDKLIASAQIPFDGKTLNLSQLGAYMINQDRSIRKKANDAICGFYQEHEEEFDQIYDEMIKVRTKLAKKLGYDNFIEVAYLRLGRTDYSEKEVEGYRMEIAKYVTPLCENIYQKIANNIGIDIKDYRNYDMSISFKTGSPIPIGDAAYKVTNAKEMYSQMDEETNEFINYMFDRNLFDLETKKGKQSGGYCTSLFSFKCPFVFANFNGTSDDIEVLTHEFGHAFQDYSSRNFSFCEYTFPTMDAAEIHSMSMEFFCYPYLNKFFKENEEKYKFEHMKGTITFLPYGALVDHFQHEVYKNVKMTKEERKATWRKLEKLYMPYKVYDNDLLNKGAWWYRQGHIFTSPFYYIDYTLAQNCAHQFYLKSLDNPKEAWEDYKRICKVGGSKTFLEIVSLGNLKNPFIEGTVEEVSNKLKKCLDGFDISKIDCVKKRINDEDTIHHDINNSNVKALELQIQEYFEKDEDDKLNKLLNELANNDINSNIILKHRIINAIKSKNIFEMSNICINTKYLREKYIFIYEKEASYFQIKNAKEDEQVLLCLILFVINLPTYIFKANKEDLEEEIKICFFEMINLVCEIGLETKQIEELNKIATKIYIK